MSSISWTRPAGDFGRFRGDRKAAAPGLRRVSLALLRGAGEYICWGVCLLPLRTDSAFWYSSGSTIERGGVLSGSSPSRAIPIRKFRTGCVV